MADIDDTNAKVCPVVKLVDTTEPPKEPRYIYRVSWNVHNYDQTTNRYISFRNERFFETKEAAELFNRMRKAAVELLGLTEHNSDGYPARITLED